MKVISIFCLLAACRLCSLQKDKDHIVKEYEETIQQLQSKYDVDISFAKQEHALSAAKVCFHVE